MTRDLHVVLVEPEIHWNTGNAGRTCLAAGAQLHLVAPLGFSLDDKNVRRAGPRLLAARAAAGVGRAGRNSRPRCRRWARPISSPPAAGVSSRSCPIRCPAVLIFGRESVGLPQPILDRHAQSTVAIPMRDPEIRSLNLSTTVALAAYEVRRQWGWR